MKQYIQGKLNYSLSQRALAGDANYFLFELCPCVSDHLQVMQSIGVTCSDQFYVIFPPSPRLIRPDYDRNHTSGITLFVLIVYDFPAISKVKWRGGGGRCGISIYVHKLSYANVYCKVHYACTMCISYWIDVGTSVCPSRRIGYPERRRMMCACVKTHRRATSAWS